MRQFTGTYGPNTVALVGDHLEHVRSDSTCRMIPIGDDTFLLEGVYDQRVRFTRNEAGEITSIVSVRPEGLGDAHRKQ